MAKQKVNGATDTPGPVVEQALATVETGGEMATTITPDMFYEDSGTNDFGKDDIAIPFIRALQDGSPEVKPREPKYIQGAEAGMFFNTVTKQIWPGDPGLVVVPVAYTPSFTEWKPNRGGFAKDHGADESIMQLTKKGGKDGKEDVLENGNVIQRAGLYYIFIVDEETGEVTEAAFSLSSTGLTISRKWNTVIRGIRIPGPNGRKIEPAMFYMSYRIKTFLDQEHAAGDFFSYQITPYKPTVGLAGPMGPHLYLAARKFKSLITEGGVTVKQEQEGSEDRVPF